MSDEVRIDDVARVREAQGTKAVRSPALRGVLPSPKPPLC